MLPLKYRTDPDLEFLQFCEPQDLNDLVDILTTDKGESRRTEYLTGDERFIKHQNDPSKAWELIAAEFQRFGADSVATIIRGGKGVVYRDILIDVCSHLKIKATKTEDIMAIEARLLQKVLADTWEKMSDEERAAFAKEAGAAAGFDPLKMAPAAIFAALQAAIQAGGFAAYQMAVIIANGAARLVLNRGLAFAANAGLVRAMAVFAGPVGWTISGLLALPMFTGPAFRVTIPATLMIACLRRKHLNRDFL
ncbi:MAG: DUF3944 domain-containing protein [Akkermansiaceae bacterium]|nr:DUF3944 domain-containing protein [Akkermansiaceae bacterium]MCF7731006.1 DUF3944 domain-containing protein [Akkermansiaceae bacterium]